MILSVSRHRVRLTIAIVALMLSALVGLSASAVHASSAPSANIVGHVTDKATGGPIEGVSVETYVSNAFGEWDWMCACSTDASGYYDVGELDAGTYRVSFQDQSGYYALQYFSGKTKPGSATGIPLSAGATATGIDAALVKASHITGRVTEKTTGDPIADVNVSVLLPDGSKSWALPAFTDASGYYDLGGLPAGTYRVVFDDQSGYYARQYFDHKPIRALARHVAVGEAATADAVNAALVEAELRPPHTTAIAPTGWRKRAAKITLKPADAGSGVFATYYKLDGGATKTYRAPFAVSARGAHTVKYWSVDWAGNVEAEHRTAFTIYRSPSGKGAPSKPSTPSSVRHGQSFAISGWIVRHTSGTHPVTLQFFRYNSGHWVYYKSTQAKVSSVLSFSKYSDSTSVRHAGKWRVRARSKVGSHYRYSGYRYFTAS